MSEDAIGQDFWSLVDKFIQVANAQEEGMKASRISSAMLYAAARYNAFLSVSGCENAEMLAEARQASLEYFADQYEKVYLENFDDLAASKMGAERG
jgi:hypothetical protein